jgi:hypothetical protein
MLLKLRTQGAAVVRVHAQNLGMVVGGTLVKLKVLGSKPVVPARPALSMEYPCDKMCQP